MDNFFNKRYTNEDGINWIQNEAKKGEIIDGVVKNMRPFGAFVEVNQGVVGLLHIEDISVSRIKSPEERFSIGQNIKVMIKSIDRNLNRIELTHKELLGSWEDNIDSYNEGEIVKGIIKEPDKNKNGIFIELKPNLVGLAEYKEGYEYGEEVKVFIKKIVRDKKKIKLLICNDQK
ncbi:MAG: S1 RNA-binding domain-containing protein [Clostridia bacterium]|nr:S1 RNA-binding domain-containing protein [Clostridia bacterium]